MAAEGAVAGPLGMIVETEAGTEISTSATVIDLTAAGIVSAIESAIEIGTGATRTDLDAHPHTDGSGPRHEIIFPAIESETAPQVRSRTDPAATRGTVGPPP